MPKLLEVCRCGKHAVVSDGTSEGLLHVVSCDQALIFLKQRGLCDTNALNEVENSPLPKETSDVSPYVRLNFHTLNLHLKKLGDWRIKNLICVLAQERGEEKVMPKEFNECLQKVISGLSPADVPCWP